MNQRKIAYLIIAHTDPTHLEKLVNAIDYKARIFIHLDAKANMADFAKIKLPISGEFIKERVKVSWGAFSIVQATLYLIKAALDTTENFSHLVLLSGQDYPIKPAWAIYDFLTNNQNRQFIRLIDMSKSPEHHMRRIVEYWFWEPFLPSFPLVDRYLRISLLKLLQMLRPIISKKPLKDIIPAFGSQWWVITSECAAYIFRFLAVNPHFVDFYKYSHAPDEHFFHTIIANSPYLVQTNGFENCRNCGPHKLANLHLIHTTLNKVHLEGDFDEIVMSDKFFVRKVTSTESSKLVELIDEKLLISPVTTEASSST